LSRMAELPGRTFFGSNHLRDRREWFMAWAPHTLKRSPLPNLSSRAERSDLPSPAPDAPAGAVRSRRVQEIAFPTEFSRVVLARLCQQRRPARTVGRWADHARDKKSCVIFLPYSAPSFFILLSHRSGSSRSNLTKASAPRFPPTPARHCDRSLSQCPRRCSRGPPANGRRWA
jgi:hypothetical protein